MGSSGNEMLSFTQLLTACAGYGTTVKTLLPKKEVCIPADQTG